MHRSGAVDAPGVRSWFRAERRVTQPGSYIALDLCNDTCLTAAVAGHYKDMVTYPKRSSLRWGSYRVGGAVEVHRLWIGGVVAAVIVCGLAIVGFLVVCGMLNYPLLGIRDGAAGRHASMLGYAGGAALAALLATAAMHFLLVTTPRPRWFFEWLAGVGTAIMVLLPLGLPEELPARVATAMVNLVLGLAIIGLIRNTAAACLCPGELTQQAHPLRILQGEQ